VCHTYQTKKPLSNLFLTVDYFPTPLLIKSMVRYILKMIDAFVDRIVSVLGALIFSQFPQFMRQYMDVLAGALAEAKKNVASIQKQAALTGKSLDSFIAKHVASVDPDFKASGRVMQESVERMRNYEQMLVEMKNSPIWKKPIVFFQNLDRSLLDAVEFKPALPLDMEAAVYAVIGIAVALFLYSSVLKAPLFLMKRRRRGVAM
jgi:hypothetical protein